ncbi:hypothetical protein DL96DRAFT_1817299 [Flagelloscypha sp. PMI_526]|nr:hypothetical protein DL96DRAFT_1817299 [Flagelloscypha sp. PMI_526]
MDARFSYLSPTNLLKNTPTSSNPAHVARIDPAAFKLLESCLGNNSRTAFLPDETVALLKEAVSKELIRATNTMEILQNSIPRIQSLLQQLTVLSTMLTEIQAQPVQPLPHIPKELGQEICKFAAFSDRNLAKSLCLVSLEIQHWVDPILFGDFKIRQFSKFMNIVSSSERLKRALGYAKSVDITSSNRERIDLGNFLTFTTSLSHLRVSSLLDVVPPSESIVPTLRFFRGDCTIINAPSFLRTVCRLTLRFSRDDEGFQISKFPWKILTTFEQLQALYINVLHTPATDSKPSSIIRAIETHTMVLTNSRSLEVLMWHGLEYFDFWSVGDWRECLELIKHPLLILCIPPRVRRRLPPGPIIEYDSHGPSFASTRTALMLIRTLRRGK